MVTYGNNEQEYREDWRWPQACWPVEAQDQGHPGADPSGASQAHAEGQQGAAVEPYFPTPEEAVGLNKEAIALGHELWGDSPEWGGVLKPNELESALASARQHWAYGSEQDDQARLAQAFAKMAWRVAGNQVFSNGNKRTAFWLTRHALDQNGLGHLSPVDHDDYEFADHLIGQDAYGKDTPPEQLSQERDRLEGNFLNLWDQRHRYGGPNPNYAQRYPDGSYLVDPYGVADQNQQRTDNEQHQQWENEGGAYTARWKGIAWELRDPWTL